MADTQDNAKKEDKSCCSGGHGGGCCGTKALLVLILVLLGGIIGYLMGSCGGHRWHGWRHHGGHPMSMAEPMSEKPSK
jgi:hypothetical protein